MVVDGAVEVSATDQPDVALGLVLDRSDSMSGARSKPRRSRRAPPRMCSRVWPFVLIGVVGLFLLDLYVKRVRLFGYRTIAMR